MFDITLYVFGKRPNSTLRPPARPFASIVLTGDLRESASVINPEIIVSFVGAPSVNRAQYNYCYIPIFNRYYFINDTIIESGEIAIYRCSCDVLATYKELIGNSTQYILRSSFVSSPNVSDGFYPRSAETTTSQQQINAPWVTSMQEGCYIMGVVNKDNTGITQNVAGGAVKYYVLTQQNLNQIMADLFLNPDWTGGITEVSQDLLQALFNPMQYIVSCMWFPLPYSSIPRLSSGTTEFRLGWWSVPSGSQILSYLSTAYGQMKPTLIIDVPKHPQASSRGNYLNSGAYSSYVLHIMPFGQIPIDAAAVYAYPKIGLDITVDFVTGEAALAVKPVESGGTVRPLPIMTVFTKLGMDIPVRGVGVKGDFAETVAVVAGAGAGNAIAGLLSGDAQNTLSTISDAALNTIAQMQVTGTSGSLGSLYIYNNIASLTGRFALIVNGDNDNHGKPVCSPYMISQIPGFIMTQGADIGGQGGLMDSNTALGEEINQIRSLMNGGFFYE